MLTILLLARLTETEAAAQVVVDATGPTADDHAWIGGLGRERAAGEGAPRAVIDWDISTFDALPVSARLPGSRYRRDGEAISYRLDDGSSLGIHDIEVYVRNGLLKSAVIWNAMPEEWETRLEWNLDWTTLESRVASSRPNFRVVDFECYQAAGEQRFVALIHAETGAEEPADTGAKESGEAGAEESAEAGLYLLDSWPDLGGLDGANVVDLEICDEVETGANRNGAAPRAVVMGLVANSKSPPPSRVNAASDECPSFYRPATKDFRARWEEFHRWFHKDIGSPPAPLPPHLATPARAKPPRPVPTCRLVELEYHEETGYLAVSRETPERDWLMITESYGQLSRGLSVAPSPVELFDLQVGLPPIPVKSLNGYDPQHGGFHGHGSGGDE